MTPELAALLVALHMGSLHGYEKVLTLVLAFGPFLLLGSVIAGRRRGEAEAEAEGAPDVARGSSRSNRA